MSAIKLPARAYRGVDGTWYVSDDANSRLCRSRTEPQAKQIALALNLHDELVGTLKQIAQDDSMDIHAAIGAARTILARATTANETKS